MIEILDLHKRFNGTKVLDGLTLRIEPHESCVIIGRSGCGKSVLLKHMIGLVKPDSGRIIVNGVDIVPLSERDLAPIRRKMGVLFQGAALFDSMTVFQNVAFPLLQHERSDMAEVRRRVAETLEVVELSGSEDKKPAELSGGMKKRVGLARAMIHRPDILFFDEPTTGLDPVMADSINNLILRVCEHVQCTSIAVTHDMTSAYKIGDRIAMMREGKIIAVGSPEEIQNSTNPIVQRFIRGVSPLPSGSPPQRATPPTAGSGAFQPTVR